ncbi:MAG: UbiA family prenyltransferase [Chitinispirillaceae bacterium]|nr:UbiA family prenyltransferase [Chitinispirillaceae bacterium]
MTSKPDQFTAMHSESPLFPFLRALRPHQWIKNLLLFGPIVLAHEFTDHAKVSVLCAAFGIMCLLSSAMYLLNDLLDRESDRAHPVKKNRPFASGALSTWTGVIAAGLFTVIAFAASTLWVNDRFTIVLGIYTVAVLLYSLVFKRWLMIDVIFLSLFYAVRLFAGGVAVHIPVSPWLLAFSCFFFLSLAFVKRFVELQLYQSRTDEEIKGRFYRPGDSALVQTAGITSGFLSVLVFLLYIANSKEVNAFYPNPLWLWMIAPLFIYWIMRVWFLAERKKIHSDPVTFAIKDGASWATAVLTGVFLTLGSIP